MTDVQHCATCATEFEASVPLCSDCGGELRPGPLPPRRRSDTTREDATAPAPPIRTEDPPDTLLMQRPGLEAEEIARVLSLEGIPCLLECQGMRRLRHASQEPAEPLAISLPVSIFVPAAVAGEDECRVA